MTRRISNTGTTWPLSTTVRNNMEVHCSGHTTHSSDWIRADSRIVMQITGNIIEITRSSIVNTVLRTPKDTRGMARMLGGSLQAIPLKVTRRIALTTTAE